MLEGLGLCDRRLYFLLAESRYAPVNRLGWRDYIRNISSILPNEIDLLVDAQDTGIGNP
jgi:hypothetical protein